MGQPLVSIIMGAYNCEATIEKCVESILQQTYKNWQFIICDDFSSDNTFDILKKYEDKDSRIIILHNECNKRLGHFRGFSRLFVPFGMLHPLCALYRLQYVPFLEKTVLSQAAG